MIDKISTFIIQQVIQNSSGFQYFVDFETIEHNFNLQLSNQLQQQILDNLSTREEVADVEISYNCFDVVLYTSYCQ